jgi:hypothetical protein
MQSNEADPDPDPEPEPKPQIPNLMSLRSLGHVKPEPKRGQRCETNLRLEGESEKRRV